MGAVGALGGATAAGAASTTSPPPAASYGHGAAGGAPTCSPRLRPPRPRTAPRRTVPALDNARQLPQESFNQGICWHLARQNDRSVASSDASQIPRTAGHD